MRVAYLSKNRDIWIKTLKTLFEECIELDSIEEILNSELVYDVIALIDFSTDELFETIRKIKSCSKLFLTPLVANSNAFESGLVINITTNPVEAQQNITNISILSDQLKGYTFTTWESRLLSFMYTRSSIKLKVLTDWKQESYYKYPLIEIFKPIDQSEAQDWLNDMVKNNMLQRENLVNQIYICPFCASAHITFTDHCINCNGINIKNDNFLHCFKCGTIAPQDEFLKNEMLCCPRCHSTLKHIGDDYDISLESGICLDCKNLSVEPNLIATCMICNKSYSPDKLIKKYFYNYSLSEFGRKQIRNNNIDIEPILQDNINYVNKEYFYNILDWMLKINQRHKTNNFSILGLHISFNDRYNYDILYQLVKKLRTIMQKTDVGTRIGNNFFWFLLPKTDLDGTKVVEERALDYFNDFSEQQISLKTIKYIPTEKDMNCSGKLLIARLSSEL